MREVPENGLADCSTRCANAAYGIVMFLVIMPLFVLNLYTWAISIMVVGLCIPLLAMAFFKYINSKERNPDSPRMNRPDQTLPAAPTHPVHTSPPRLTVCLEVEAARRHAASLQPPAYPEVVVDSPGPAPPLYTAPASDEASMKVFGPSSDGLPSYEAAVSTWQPPADEEQPSRRDDGQRTND